MCNCSSTRDADTLHPADECLIIATLEPFKTRAETVQEETELCQLCQTLKEIKKKPKNKTNKKTKQKKKTSWENANVHFRDLLCNFTLFLDRM